MVACWVEAILSQDLDEWEQKENNEQEKMTTSAWENEYYAGS